MIKEILYQNKIPITGDSLAEDEKVKRKRSCIAAKALVHLPDTRLVKVELVDYRYPTNPPYIVREVGSMDGVFTSFTDRRGDKRRDPDRVFRFHFASDGNIARPATEYFDHYSYGPVVYTSDGKGWLFCTERRGPGISLHRINRVIVIE